MRTGVATNSSGTSWPQLSQSSVSKLNQLVQFTTELRQATCQPGDRIQRGSPRARILGVLMARKRRDFQQLSINQIFQDDSDFPGVCVLRAHFTVFQETLETQFSDAGNDQGYTQRVFYLERLMYDSGLMRGLAEMILEQNSYWRSKTTGIQHQPLARPLNFGSSERENDENPPLARQLPSQPNITQSSSPFLLSRQPPTPLSTLAPSQSNSTITVPSTLPLPLYTQHPSPPSLAPSQPSNTVSLSSTFLLSGNPPSLANSNQSTSPLPPLRRRPRAQANVSQNPSQPAQSSQSRSPQQVVDISSARNVPNIASQGTGLVVGPSALAPVNPAVPSSPAYSSSAQLPPFVTRGPVHVQTSQSSTQDPQSVTEDPVTVKVDLLSHVNSRIVSLWKEKKHTDVTFLVGEGKKRVLTHRAILACQSDYFDTLLFGDMLEASKDEIALDDVALPECFDLLVNYAYTGQLEIENGKLQDVLDVLAMADRFGFVQLKEALSEKLASMVTLKNVLHLLLYGDLYQASSLLNQCLATVDQKAEKVLSSDAFLTLATSTLSLIISRDTFFVPEMFVYNAVVGWKDYNGVSKEELEEVLGYVRLSQIPPKELFRTVEPAQLFRPVEITDALRVQIKPEFQQMKPRGRKVSGKNVLEFGKFAAVGKGGNVTYGSSNFMVCVPPSLLDAVVTLDAPRKSTVSSSSSNLPIRASQPAEPIQSSQVYGASPIGAGLLGGCLQQPAVLGSGLMLGRPIQGSTQPARSSVAGGLKTFGQKRANSHRTTTVELNDVHLINKITFRPFTFSPSSTRHSGTGSSDVSGLLPSTTCQANQWCFSYKIHISKNKENWETLFDFSGMDCYFDQILQFPTQAVKYIEFELTSCAQHLQLNFINCSFEEDMKPFNFKENGVIAPLYPCSLVGYQVAEVPPWKGLDTDVVAAKTVVINTPHSMSQLSFKMLGPDDIQSGNIEVLVSATWESESFKNIGSLSAKEFKTEVCVRFDEMVVSYILVLIRDVQKKAPKPETATSESPGSNSNLTFSTSKLFSSPAKDPFHFPQFKQATTGTVTPVKKDLQVGVDLSTDEDDGSSSYTIVDVKCQVSPTS